MKNNVIHNLRYNINNRLKNINIEKLKRIKGFLKRTSIAFSLILLILILKKINVRPTNALLDFLGARVNEEFNLVKEAKDIYTRGENLIGSNDKILKVFSPGLEEKYPSPISGSLHTEYKKGENEGVDIKSKTGDDPISITDGKVTNVEIIDKKGYFITVEKENLELIYGYLSKPHVSSGEEIKKGTALGSLGTNKDQAKYLRLEIKVDGKSVDPLEYINVK